MGGEQRAEDKAQQARDQSKADEKAAIVSANKAEESAKTAAVQKKAAEFRTESKTEEADNKEEEAAKEADEQEKKAQEELGPKATSAAEFSVGHRVSHVQSQKGTVVSVKDGSVKVKFDKSGEHRVFSKYSISELRKSP